MDYRAGARAGAGAGAGAEAGPKWNGSTTLACCTFSVAVGMFIFYGSLHLPKQSRDCANIETGLLTHHIYMDLEM